MPPRRQIPGLDGLRAIACLAVFGVHLQQLTGIGGRAGSFDFKLLLENGNTGVCLFFMLSGFLLSLPFWSATERSDESPRGLGWAGGFALRRIGRILPAYYVCLFALAFSGKGEGPRDLAMHALFIHNLSESTIYSINEPFWTLAVQAQFYVVFAVMMLLLAPLTKHRATMAVLLLSGIVGFFLAHLAIMQRFQPPPTAMRSFVLSHSILAHLPHFLLGMLAALAFASTSRPTEAGMEQRSLWNDVLFWAALAGMIYVLGVPAQDARWRIPTGEARDPLMLGRYNFPYIPLLVAVVIFTAPRARITTSLLEFRPLRSIGVISFGFYVYHLPCLLWVKRMMANANAPLEQHWVLFGLTGLALALVVSLASYALVELPLLRWMRRRASRTVNKT